MYGIYQPTTRGYVGNKLLYIQGVRTLTERYHHARIWAASRTFNFTSGTVSETSLQIGTIHSTCSHTDL
jgi:hypothetical protein